MLDVVIIGGGQAGLAAAYYLNQSRARFLIVEKGPSIGDSWRQRYDSLQLFTPRKHSQLPGLLLSGRPEGFPGKDEVADYLSAYAVNFSLPVQFNTEVMSAFAVSGGFVIETTRGVLQARNIIAATGPFHVPFIPPFANQISAGVTQLHSSVYRNKNQLKKGNVLVVGAGNSGAQIAVELAGAFDVRLSASRPLHFMPLTLFGKSIFDYYETFGLLRAGQLTKRGIWLKRQPEQIYGLDLQKRLKDKTIALLPKAVQAEGNILTFEDGRRLEADNVIWATGFRSDFSWLKLEDHGGRQQNVCHQDGVSNVPGLYFIGLPWLTCRGSALLGWVRHDAKRIVQHILGTSSIGIQ
ncbi:NAD(P)-binding domain-containing protein [Paenibacillus sp. FSL M7-1455]|uniref:flavin-containing monooxygenase n=1 Tax=Paenibacillus sp. FSL M7-1455 TaxID=2975316 RepID=UPI0030FC99C9